MTGENGKLLCCQAQNKPHRTNVRLGLFYLDVANFTRFHLSLDFAASTICSKI